MRRRRRITWRSWINKRITIVMVGMAAGTRTMTRIRKPSGLLNAIDRRPRSNEDFLGWYQPTWFPWLKIEIQKNGDRYFSREQEYHDYPGVWYTPAEPLSLTPLPGQLGFICNQNNRGSDRLVYNEGLKRFEIVIERAEMTPSIVRMPLARIPTPSSTGDDRAPAPTVLIGIPSWN